MSRLTAPISSGNAARFTFVEKPDGRRERPEEVVVVVGDDHRGVERPQDALPVIVGEAAPGDAGEEHVDAAALGTSSSIRFALPWW